MVTTRRTVLAALLAVTGVCQPVFAADEPTAWDTDYARVREAATATDRPILLSIGSTSCGWCTKLHATTFRDREVIATLDRGFVTGKIDAGRHPDLVRALGVKVYPTLVIAAPDGKILHTVEGYQTAEEMNRTLRHAQELLRAHREKVILTGGAKSK
ncbi:protein disulfide-isomerase : Uncharacterized protein OS=Planctomyces maris DSM 8797 GN=PM8797T_14179 PE=4 SV=1: Thioredox_DsbH [Gemmataceae bacterium]|nr:protein disulfide-isomerase : Uncharacterized protein OS=Planctomyces maris DSM 8797 GN=PM8797T_14179 PE=4 SV=1: Thioredox_DsbH [Gemmataceae bacterium]VTT99572.1 protein disulfide-isomerase : Uncharacterized protein OS=Planctomyces maris DSM 8797 GN=PM8797T_14179 PE=4 SV=1: Thioredox_DsbH [Gemmataceae bacterium]